MGYFQLYLYISVLFCIGANLPCAAVTTSPYLNYNISDIADLCHISQSPDPLGRSPRVGDFMAWRGSIKMGPEGIWASLQTESRDPTFRVRKSRWHLNKAWPTTCKCISRISSWNSWDFKISLGIFIFCLSSSPDRPPVELTENQSVVPKIGYSFLAQKEGDLGQ